MQCLCEIGGRGSPRFRMPAAFLPFCAFLREIYSFCFVVKSSLPQHVVSLPGCLDLARRIHTFFTLTKQRHFIHTSHPCVVISYRVKVPLFRISSLPLLFFSIVYPSLSSSSPLSRGARAFPILFPPSLWPVRHLVVCESVAASFLRPFCVSSVSLS